MNKTSIVVFPVNNSYMDAVVHDFLMQPEVSKCCHSRNKWLRKLQYYHTSIKANKFFKLPFQSIWYPTYIPKPYESDVQYIFLFYQGTPLGYDKNFLLYLRKLYKGAKLCFYWNNISSTVSEDYITLVNTEYDVVYTFDKNDVKKYGWRFYDVMYSDISKWDLPKMEASDLFFIGSAKNRLDLIHGIYDKFQSMGYKCDFHIVNVPREEQTRPGIVYNERMSYLEVLGHSASTKIILEIVQDGQIGATLRSFESILLRKKLLTNNKGILSSNFNSGVVFLFEKLDDIHPNKIIASPIDGKELETLSNYLKPERFISDLKEA